MKKVTVMRFELLLVAFFVLRAKFYVKGREYLEKIIQFRMLMPQRTPQQVQKLIAGRYPELAAAGDIIREATGTPEAVGTNPRRVKQYCEHLIFQKMVEQGDDAAKDDGTKLDERDKALLHRLILFHQQEPRLLHTLALVIPNGNAFRAALSVAAGVETERDEHVKETERDEHVKEEVWNDFRGAVAGSHPLLELLRAVGDRAAEDDALKMATFARIADLTPEGRDVLNTQDGPFLNVPPPCSTAA